MQGPATDVELAIAWYPPADAFERYPNLKAVCSIGAGVDNILRVPSLRAGIDVVRVVEPGAGADDVRLRHLARDLASAALSRPIWPSSASERWQRLRHRAGRRTCRSAFWVMARSAAGSPADLALLGFPVHGVEPNAQSRRRTACTAFTAPPVSTAMLGETEVLINLLPLTPETHGHSQPQRHSRA